MADVDTLLRVPDVLAAAGVSRSTLYEMMESGKFPKPVKPNDDRAVRRLASEVVDWQKARIAVRDNATAA
jgi:prophage regulatory protein